MKTVNNKKLLIVGLMSGTSVDGIDAALVSTNGQTLECIQRSSSHYQKTTRDAILYAYNEPETFLNSTSSVKVLSKAIAQDHAMAVMKVVEAAPGISQEQVQLLGFHGQTILHKPNEGFSVQLGCAKTLANITSINTVHDFRQADLAAGGQGAPLAPVYHLALMKQAELELPAIMLNIGGVANLSYWDGQELIGFDTGPGNGLLDQYMQQHVNCPFDNDGALAAQGNANQQLVNAFLGDRYFDGVKPKSLDRSSFNAILASIDLNRLSAADAMATLTLVTVFSIKRALDQFSNRPKQLLVCGGGQHNTHLLNELKRHLALVVTTADAMQLAGDHIEAELMALLAARYHYSLPSTYPLTTGVAKACVAGKLQLANSEQ